MRDIRHVCVFCGSKAGERPEYRAAAVAVGRQLVERGWGLVYGGGSVGLMGVVADAVLEAGGEVIGVIPEALATKELLHAGVQPMHVTPGMHARKQLMADHSDAFVALPGGFGTFEELFEIVTWSQLGLHAKPVGLLNTAGFYVPLVNLIEHAIAEGFIKPAHRDLLVVSDDPAALLDRLQTHVLPPVRRWIRTDEQT
jgi:uncharacterized protein (TIGR00730 family)